MSAAVGFLNAFTLFALALFALALFAAALFAVVLFLDGISYLCGGILFDERDELNRPKSA
jgi:hypothetical protein